MTKTITWQTVLGDEKQKPYFQKILNHIKKERRSGKIIYPPQTDIFHSLRLTPYESVKVVILGQDPYHGPNQAHGLAFSVRLGIPIPPSLQNIFKELHSDLNLSIPFHGCLEKWAKQGVLLLNTTLTVEAGKPQSHININWHQFTDQVIVRLNNHHKGIVFLLWGSYAQQKAQLINKLRHRILKASHPSPLSVKRSFFGCRHFSKANALLRNMGRRQIDWSLD
ncbi:uracil-DNA glycosylase [Coxiella endosymbiont of Amblyomma nuttalli]|uniref:uracil-DNA glycosylase n=1 Tax=Coxiella endosymbiont of Amblyomma nuttalli TaxID=2749996 RepID=UPI001BADF1C7|nr:uracil-DNA glycosylase [Coxiella endosymbiont of Amblyomma nuttalli]QTS83937.1 Uracil-DNA glycosylase [Coxiella endosymbiont of Amblyomma nuttalli]